jgi:hypothetical protein
MVENPRAALPPDDFPETLEDTPEFVGSNSPNQVVLQRVVAGTIALLGIAAAVIAAGYGIYEDNQPQPGLYPFVVCIPLVIGSLVWFFTASRPQQESGQSADVAEVDEPIEPGAGTRRMLWVLGLSVMAIVLFEPAGFVVTIALYIGGLLTLVGRVRPQWAIPGAIVAAVLTKVLMDTLGLSLPPLPFGIELLGL